MGILSALGLNKKTESVQAQYAPAIMDTAYGYGSFTTGVGNFPGGLDRNLAMQVPAVSRCRNLIAGVVSYLPLKLYKKSNGEELGNPLCIPFHHFILHLTLNPCFLCLKNPLNPA